jgi:hypothetical protein
VAVSLEFVVKATDACSAVFQKIGLSADRLDKQIGDLGKRIATPTVGLDDKKFALGMINAAKRLDKLSAMVADPSIEVDTRQAQTEILRISALLDRLDAKRVNVTVGARGGVLSRVMGLFGGGAAGAAGAAGPAAGPGLAGLGAAGPWGAAALGAAGIGAAALAPSALAALGGLGAAGAGVLGAFHYDPKVFAPGLRMISSSLSNVFKSIAPSIGMIVASLGRFARLQMPNLAKLFGASLPFLQAFVKFGMQAVRLVLPAFTQMLKQMAPSLPLISQGLLAVVQGLTDMIRALGPRGMRASAQVFVGLAKTMGAALTVFGKVLNFTAIAVYTTARTIHKSWDWLRHATDDVFTRMRHDIAAIWDAIYRNTIGAVIRIVRAVVNWFNKLPGSIRNALSGLGKMLMGIATGSMNSFLSGLKSVGGSILSWIKNFFAGIPKAILSLLHMSPPHKGSVFFDLGANLMHHLEAGIQSKARGLLGTVGRAIGGAIGHGTGPTAGGIQQLAFEIARARGWAGQWGAINAVEMAEAGWSLTARNPSSGAYGIAQFINGPSEYYQWGGNPNTAAGQIVAFYNYIASRYRTPAAAWAHEQAFHWYGKGLQGGIFRRPTIIGVGDRPGGEVVDVRPLGQARRSGPMVNVEQMVVQDATDIHLVASRLSFMASAAGFGS